MTTKTLLNVDFYRNLLVDDPGRFMGVVEGNGFPFALVEEIRYLWNGMITRKFEADKKCFKLLDAKINVAMGWPDKVTDEIRKEFSSSEDPLTEELSSMSLNPLDPLQREGKREPFKAPNDDDESIPIECQKLITICYLMKVHKRLVDLIEKTPIFNTGWSLIDPNQAQILGLHKTPAPDNNSNSSHFH